VRFDENNACTALNLIYFFSLPYFPEKSKHFLGNAQKAAPNKGGLRATPSGGVDTSMIVRTKDFDKPVVQLKKGGYKMKPGLVYLGFSTDFLIEEADQWRGACWSMIKERSDCSFLFLTQKVWYKSPLNTDKG
jgi:hypothetical protein